ncbi:hypothetical protein E1B28_002506 [Marasmius oreades]|uniref:Cupin-like domain-containing protein n=1 Tax=Marasmius oreades TaxID=181124 RepID=A0A9P7RNQ8_9AGAR|nr:uncharacterized protein E1B28_002506 [Marasmius oreades]KAG7086558.1 hypothetical protein E1B28_002506 [Marasmius oreades]
MQPSFSDTSWSTRIIAEISQQLGDTSDRATAQLLGCGEDNFNLLLSAVQDLVAETPRSNSCGTLEALAKLAHTKMSSGEAQICWRRMYTDAHILLSLSELSPHTALHAIGYLDRAIIIAGAAGDGRLDLILSLISNIQSNYVQSHHFSLTRSRFEPNSSVHEPLVLHTSRHAIPSLNSPPSLETFQTKSYTNPFILRKFASNWPALNEHPWSSAAYLRSVAGPGRLVPIEVGTDYRADDWTQMLMSWDDFLTSLDLDGQSAVPEDVLYLAQHNLLMQFPELNSDITIPDYAYSSLPSPPDYPKYRSPNNEDQLVVNGWLGPKGTISPAHTDPYYNLFDSWTEDRMVDVPSTVKTHVSVCRSTLRESSGE